MRVAEDSVFGVVEEDGVAVGEDEEVAVGEEVQERVKIVLLAAVGVAGEFQEPEEPKQRRRSSRRR
ncbi:hypothetical protein GLYMA_01G042200v4 [Glycine max]|uniref:Uncharacterized protein n=2 Tax=Glycine subgen. Soja TaxID=1462606 RepID=A0A0R0L6A8_SOYBN|nr:hypothetical protein JHK87_000405 [Glycine soja]KAG5068027.1 hypothetical protein JHK85_000404 [Glycine max]KAG5087788.1 hypothetical protein JHK86_000400 [Glycine max]KAH1161554.1 hypothetical protein GYH30_000439 [Glycine max]KRH74768.1 hypothetical protein GLYMA_01G042200v4 [Glycine max]